MTMPRPRTFQKGSGQTTLTYPLRLADIPQDIGIVNPCDGNHHNICPPYETNTLEYEEEADMLIRVAIDVERGIWPAYYFDFCGINSEISPVLRAVGLTETYPKGCADAVHMDQPQELWAAIVSYVAREKIPVDPNGKGIRFLETTVDPLALFGRTVKQAMREAFEVKYYYGLTRVEEYFNSPNFAHYPEGCPRHPAYVSGHATVGGDANQCFLTAFPHASASQKAAVELATKQFGHFRDLARVHTRQDSKKGWELGNRLR